MSSRSEKWAMVRVPRELAERLDRVAAELMRNHVEGKSALPPEYVEHCPLHHAIAVALDRLEDHRGWRARKAARATAKAVAGSSGESVKTS